MSTSPSVGHENGSFGRSQNAGQIPGATGAVIRAEREPRLRSRPLWDDRRAEVYAFCLSGWEWSMMARRKRASVVFPSALNFPWNELWGEAT